LVAAAVPGTRLNPGQQARSPLPLLPDVFFFDAFFAAAFFAVAITWLDQAFGVKGCTGTNEKP
jgi:hypothetical protein